MTLTLEEAAKDFVLVKDCSPSYRPRKLRELINKYGTPCIKQGSKIFLKPEHLDMLIESLITCSKSQKSKPRKTGTSGAQSKELRSSSLRGLRAEILQSEKREK